MRFPLILPYFQIASIARFKVLWALFEMSFQLRFHQYFAALERAGDISVQALPYVLQSFLIFHAEKVHIFLVFNLLVDLAPPLLVLANEPFLVESFFDESMDVRKVRV